MNRFIRSATRADRRWIAELLDRWWGGPIEIVDGESIDLRDHPALVAGSRLGVAIFRYAPKHELLLLQAVTPGKGIGSELLLALVSDLRERGAAQLFVTTTNANERALSFYERHGFRRFATREGAVDRARLLKPAIPTTAANGIPIRDEIELILIIDDAKALNAS